MPEGLQSVVTRLRGRNAWLLAVGVGTVIVIVAISRWATAPVWVPLLPGMSLESVGEVTAKLDEQGIPYRLNGAGAQVTVAEGDLARARVQLAAEGIPDAKRPGFELFDKPTWGMTDFTQRINYRRALEGELERTIAQMRGVQAAQVHLALRESSAYRREDASEAASVVLNLRTGERPGGELVDAIASLVASSVDGVTSDKVTVLDDAGHLLNAAVEPGSPAGVSKRQLALRRDIEGYLATKAEALVTEVFGPGNVRVQVAADLNLDRLERTTQTVDPDQQATAKEEKSEIVPSPGQQGAGSTASSTVYENSRQVETFSAGMGNIKRMTVAVLVNDRKDGDKVVPRTASELARVQTLVGNAVGLDPQRGDAISIMSFPFDAPEAAPVPPVTGPDLWQRLQMFERPIITVLALLTVLIIAMRVMKGLRLAPAARPAALPAGEGGQTLPRPQNEQQLRERFQKAHPIAPTIGDPEMAARVMRAWIRES